MDDLVFKEIIEASPIGFSYNQIILDDSGKPIDYILLEMNSALKDFTGFDRSIIGKKRSEVVKEPLENRTFWIEHYGQVALSGVPKTVEHFTTAFQRFVRVFIYSPKKGFFISLLTDITKERKDSHEKLAMLKVLGEFVYELDENYKLTNIYTNNESLLPFPRQKIIGKSIVDLVSSNLSTLFIEAMKKAKAFGVMQTITYLSPFANDLSWHKAEVYFVDINGSRRFISRITNIDEQIKATEALRKSEEKYRLMAENTSDVIWVYNATLNKFTYASPSVIYLRGYTPEEVIKLTLEESLTPESMAVVSKAMARLLPIINKNRHYVDDTTYELQQPLQRRKFSMGGNFHKIPL